MIEMYERDEKNRMLRIVRCKTDKEKEKINYITISKSSRASAEGSVGI
jgi:phage anti-repressor protein